MDKQTEDYLKVKEILSKYGKVDFKQHGLSLKDNKCETSVTFTLTFDL